MRRGIHILIFILCCACVKGQQESKTAQSLKAAGYVNIHDLDSTIQVDLMYSRADNFTGKVLYTDLKEAYLHPKAAKALVVAQQLLKAERPDLSLKIYDAARPMHIQQRMWNVVKGTPQQNYVSNPKNGGGLHNYGMAVDVTLCYENGDTLDMGTVIDYLGKWAHIDIEDDMMIKGIISNEAYNNRRLLRDIMKRAGFKALRSEWWHFNYITRAEAKAHYKVIK
ncbi:MAG: M15 family metallopeptidase [Paraprevotella sp.]|nr:M15 family metallopeptidase [Paraprevotella sp.]